jgi:hypothetical protein
MDKYWADSTGRRNASRTETSDGCEEAAFGQIHTPNARRAVGLSRIAAPPAARGTPMRLIHKAARAALVTLLVCAALCSLPLQLVLLFTRAQSARR